MSNMETFREKVRNRWPHYDDKTHVFAPGATQDEMRRVALETQLDCKITSRSHLAEFDAFLPKLYYAGPVADCDFSALPPRYAIKPRCQTGVVMLMDHGVERKTGRPVSVDEIRATLASQWCYRGLNNDVIVEEIIENADGQPCFSQLKCLTFHGRVEFIHYVTLGYDSHSVSYDYDRRWRRVRLYRSAQPIDAEVPQPTHFARAIELADDLANYYRRWTGIEHVRVDLYDSDKGPVFGEYAGGTNGGEGFTDEAQLMLGKLW